MSLFFSAAHVYHDYLYTQGDGLLFSSRVRKLYLCCRVLLSLGKSPIVAYNAVVTNHIYQNMYPTIVVTLVNTQRSVVDTYSLGPEFGGTEIHVGDRPAAGDHLSFARPITQASAGTELALGTGVRSQVDTRGGRIASLQVVDFVDENKSEKNV